MDGLGSLPGVAILFILIAFVLACLMPFFVFRIRNEMISMNHKMEELLKLLGGSNSNYSNIEITKSGKKIKKCMQCGTNNRFEDHKCMNCDAPIP